MGRALWLALVLCIGGCLDRSSVVCADGRICSAGTVCVAGLDVCAEPDQLAVCSGRADGTECVTTSIADGICKAGVCLPSRCGDGVVSAAEACDPAATPTVPCAGAMFDRGFAGCSTSCEPLTSDETCGYIGWRTRNKQPEDPVVSISALAWGRGFYATRNGAGPYENHEGLTLTYASSSPITQVWAFNDSAAIVIGEGGMIAWWTGTVWVDELPASTGTSEHLRAVWGRSADDVFVVGDRGTVLRYHGAQWSSLAPPTTAHLRAVAGDDTRVYVAGDGGTLLVYENNAWRSLDAGTTRDLHGVWTAAGYVVAVGARGTIVEDDGSGWRSGRSTAVVDLHSVWGSEQDGFFAAGDGGTLMFLDGEVWRRLALGRGVSGSPTQDFTVLGGVPGVEIGAIGSEDIVTYEGAAWAPLAIPTTEHIAAIWGRSSSDVFAVGTRGTILHHDGLAWTVQDSGTTSDLHGVAGDSDTTYAVGADMTVLASSGTAWTLLHTEPGASTLDAVAVTSSSLVTAGATGIFAGSEPTLVSSIGARALSMTDTAGAAAGKRVQRWTPAGGWLIDQNLPIAGELTAISATRPDDIYVVGSSSHHFTSAWTLGPFTDTDLDGVFASSELGVFAVGPDKLRHWNGSKVEPLASRVSTGLRAVFAAGHVIFIGGDDGTLQTLVFHR